MTSIATGSGSTDLFLSKRFLVFKMKESDQTKFKDQIPFLKTYLEKQTNCPKCKVPILHKQISHFVSDYKNKLIKSNRMFDRFLSKHTVWLDTSIAFPTHRTEEKAGAGRPTIDFIDSSERSKRLKTQHLRSQYSPGELSYAAQMSLRSSGQTDASQLLKEITNTSPNHATRYRTALRTSHITKREKLSPEEALSMFVDAKLTRRQYNIIREKDVERFPSYKIIQKAKKDCYPEQIIVTDVFFSTVWEDPVGSSSSCLDQSHCRLLRR